MHKANNVGPHADPCTIPLVTNKMLDSKIINNDCLSAMCQID